jgi:hypothetical protein
MASVGTLLNPRSVTTVARHATVVVAVPSTVHYPANYKIKNISLQMKFKNVNRLFRLIICYKLLKSIFL